MGGAAVRRYIALGLVLFSLLYLEPISIAGVKFSYIWKAVLIVVLVVVSAAKLKSTDYKVQFANRSAKILYILWMLSAVLIVAEFVQSPIGDQFALLFQMLLPTVFATWLLLTPSVTSAGASNLSFVGAFVAASTLPFHLTLLPELGKRYELTHIYGYEAYGFTGVFQNPSSAALALAFSVLLCFHAMVSSGKTQIRVLWLGLLLLAFGSLFMTNVRSGILSVILGSTIYLAIRYKSRAVLYGLMMAAIGGGALVATVPDLEAYWLRMQGHTQYAVSRGDTGLDRMSSGRVSLVGTAFEIYVDSNPMQKVFGIGRLNIPDEMFERGMPAVLSHNTFVDELVGGGILGLAVLLAWYIFLARATMSLDTRSERAIYGALVVAFVGFSLVKSADYSTHILILTLILGAGSRFHSARGSGEALESGTALRGRK